MRIIKLSALDDMMKSIEAVHDFFTKELISRRGKFFVTLGRIAPDGINVGETLIFTYEKEIVYIAKANSSRLESGSKDTPFYFEVDVNTIKKGYGSLSELELQLKGSKVISSERNLVKSQGWPTFDTSKKRLIVDKIVDGFLVKPNSEIAFHWVNIGDSYKEVQEQKFLWAPTFKVIDGEKIRHNAGWDSVNNVKKNDIIFCNCDGALIYVVVAKDRSYIAPRPLNRTFNKWHNEGYKVDVEMVELSPSIPVNSLKNELNSLLSDDLKPKVFNKNLDNCQIYMAPLSKVAGAFLLDCTDEQSIEVHDKREDTALQTALGRDKDVMSKARVGQGKFRDGLLSLWNNTCPITFINTPSLLIASHIVPWQLANAEDKVNIHNGLLLAPHIDKLFDKGFISFSDSGKIIFHSKLTPETANKLGITEATQLKNLKQENLPFLKKHREIFGF
ncbi:MAG: putative restriction endonuclease [Psychroserpens sp.]|jgi:putative restriction endonuclease